MNTNRAAYWIALGVLALGLNSEYQQGRFPALHSVAKHAGSALCRISMRAHEIQTFARLLTSRQDPLADGLIASTDQAEIARDQAKFVREEIRARAEVIRAQSEMRHAGIEQIQWHTRSQLGLARAADRRLMVICPKTGARIAVNDDSKFAYVSQDIDLDDSD
jgi:hypothetical protein